MELKDCFEANTTISAIRFGIRAQSSIRDITVPDEASGHEHLSALRDVTTFLRSAAPASLLNSVESIGCAERFTTWQVVPTGLPEPYRSLPSAMRRIFEARIKLRSTHIAAVAKQFAVEQKGFEVEGTDYESLLFGFGRGQDSRRNATVVSCLVYPRFFRKEILRKMVD